MQVSSFSVDNYKTIFYNKKPLVILTDQIMHYLRVIPGLLCRHHCYKKITLMLY